VSTLLSLLDTAALTCMRDAAQTGVTQNRVVAGWRLRLQHRDDVWRLFARLEPYGRSSTSVDWSTLGALVQALGAPESPLVPVAETPPNESLEWAWRDTAGPVPTAWLPPLNAPCRPLPDAWTATPFQQGRTEGRQYDRSDGLRVLVSTAATPSGPLRQISASLRGGALTPAHLRFVEEHFLLPDRDYRGPAEYGTSVRHWLQRGADPFEAN